MVVSEGAINNIMGGMENTAGVRLHSHRHKLKQRFDIIRKLGQGTYGKVQLAINKETGQEVAIKTIKKSKIETEQDLIRIRREIQIMSSVQHPQIIHIYEVFENRDKMVLVMEYAAGGELYDYLSEKKVLSEAEARRVFRHVASATYYCHKHKICHRDLKLENILLDLEGNAKIADFGLANVFDEKHRLDTFCGSPLYASPEIVKGVPYFGPEVDCWSLGVLLYTLVYGAMPFDGSNFRRLVKQITQGDFYEPSTPASASELIRHMLTVEPTERANIADICNHWWVNDGYPESCFVEAEALANLTPVRLDLLLSLAPKNISSEHLLIQPEDDDSQNCQQMVKAAPDLHIPPPPSQEAENEALPPPRSHSMGSLTPGSRLDIDLILEKKKLEKKAQEEKKRPNEEGQHVEKKKKKEASTKKSSSRIMQEESTENKKVKKEQDKKSKEVSDSTGAKKRDSSSTRKSPSTKKSDVSPKEESVEPEFRIVQETSVVQKVPAVPEIPIELEAPIVLEVVPTEKLVTDPAVKVPVSNRSISPSPSTSSTLRASGSSISRKSSVSPSKTIKDEQPSVKPKEKSVPKSDSAVKKVPDRTALKTISTDKILQETAAKMEKVESLILEEKKEAPSSQVSSQLPAEKEEFSPPVPTASPAMSSPVSSVTSSQTTTPARSRTCSESSTDTRSVSKGDSSRRQSKILSKAALFDSMLASGIKTPSVVDKPKKTRPGPLNISDFTKKFEEKPTEKKPKVMPIFKVSDARKAFEVKTDQYLENGRRKSSAGSSGGASASTSPRESLPTSPLKPDKSFSLVEPVSSSDNVEENSKVSVEVKESSPIKEGVKKSVVPKSASKDLKKSISIKKEKSPSPSVKKEKSPSISDIKKDKSSTPIAMKKEKTPTPVTTKKEKSATPSKKEKSPSPVKTKGTQSKIDQKSSAPTIPKKEEVKVVPTQQQSVIKKKIPPSVAMIIDIKVDTSDSSDSESEAEKMLRMLAERREKCERTKKEKLRKASELKEKTAAVAAQEQRLVPTSTTASSRISDNLESDNKEQKFATLPRGFKSKTPTRSKPAWDPENDGSLPPDETVGPKSVPPSGKRIPIMKEVVAISPEQVLSPTPREATRLTNVNSFSDMESPKKKTQIDIVLNQQSAKKQPLRPQKSFEIKISRDNSRPEFRTEVEHIVNAPETRVIEPQLQRAPRERIIPIMMVDDSNSSPIQPSLSSSSKASSASSTRVTNFGMAPISSTLGSSAAAERNMMRSNASPESIKKSRRERIIPIAVEGEGIISPSISESASSEGVRGSFQRQGSGARNTSGGLDNDLRRGPRLGSVDSLPPTGGRKPAQRRSVHRYSRGRSFMVDRNDSFSSAGEDDDEDDDDGFQILTAESLFSTLLSRVRNLTRKMTDDGRPRRLPQPNMPGDQDPNGFWSSLYSTPRDSPARRVSDGLSRAQSKEEDPFGGFNSPMWTRNSMSRDGSDAESVFSEPNFSTLPRGWRSRRSVTREDPETPKGSFATIRRPYSSRTQSRDYLDANESLNSSSSQGHQQHNLGVLRQSAPRDRRSYSSGGRPSGEAKGLVGGQYESQCSTPVMVSPQGGIENKESFQQLKDLVQELESQEQQSTPSSNSRYQSISSPTAKSNFSTFIDQSKPETTNGLKKKTFRSGSGSTNLLNLTSPTISKSMSIGSSPASFRNPSGKTTIIPHSVHVINKSLGKDKNDLSNSFIVGQTQRVKNELSKDKLGECNSSCNNISILPSIPKQDFIKNESRIPSQNNASFINGASQVNMVGNMFKSQNEKPTFLVSEHYRRGRSEDLRSSIDIVNKGDLTGSISAKPYRRSKSKDLTPSIEAASGIFSQPNQVTPRKISPFEAYRRSKSREMNNAIDQATKNGAASGSNLPNSFIETNSKSLINNNSRKPTDQVQLDKSVPTQLSALHEETSLASSTDAISSQTHVNLSTIPVVIRESQPSIHTTTEQIICLQPVPSIEMTEERESTPDSSLESLKKQKLKDSNDKSNKSMYKMLTSKFTRSLSNVGEEFKNSQKRETLEDDIVDKGDKFKLKKPSIFLKYREKSVPLTNVNDSESIKDEDCSDFSRGDKKSPGKLSHAFNKILGRKPDEILDKPSVKTELLITPMKSTSAAIISDKYKKPPRFRSKNYSKSHENLNKKIELENYTFASNGTVPIQNQTAVNVESTTRDLCNHLSEIENDLASTIQRTNCKNTDFRTPYDPSNAVGRSRKIGIRNMKLDLNQDVSVSAILEGDRIKKLSGELSEDGSLSPTTESGTESLASTLEDIKEADDDDESVMDRITRKSYYSRFNEIKRKPKIRVIESKESIDQQLAAAKARLMKDDVESLNVARQSLSPSRKVSPSMISPISQAWNEVPRRTATKQVGPRTTSLPPEDAFYSPKSSFSQEPQIRRHQTPVMEERRMSMEREERRLSIDREENPRLYRATSAAREEPRRSSVSRNITSMTRDIPSYSRQSSMVRDNPPTVYGRSASVTRDESNHRRSHISRPRESQERTLNIESDSKPEHMRVFSPPIGESKRRTPSISRDDMRLKRLSSVSRDLPPSYQTLPYRKASTIHLDNLSNKMTSSYGNDMPLKHAVQRKIASPNEFSGHKSMNTALSAANEAGKKAGIAAATETSSKNSAIENIPINSSVDSAAVVSAREELNRRLTPLTRLSNMAGESSARPYRRTVTSGSIPIGQNNRPNISREIPTYKRTHTLDLPVSERRIQSPDYTRSGLQDPSRRYSGVRSSISESDPSMSCYVSRRSSLINPSSYNSYTSPTSSYLSSPGTMAYDSSLRPIYEQNSSSYSSPPSTSLYRRSTLYNRY